MADYRVFWGEAHDNTYQLEDRSLPINENLTLAASHLDFYAAAYYTASAGAFQPEGHLAESDRPHALVLEDWKDENRLEWEWQEVQQACRNFYRPGQFVTFPGYEWQGDGSSGDHNVFFLREGYPIFRVNALSELYHCLRSSCHDGYEAMAIPHHIGYRPGRRGRDWSVFDEELSPFAEIYSIHGCSETDEEWIGLRQNSHMGPGQGGGTYQDALDRGYHLGAVCSTDNWGQMPGHYGRGLMACLAKELTRESLWKAFKTRRVYGVTGDRIQIDFRLNNAPMGSIVESNDKRTIAVRVVGSDALDRIELLRNGNVINTHCHQGTWGWPQPGERSRFKLRIEAGWGPRPNEMEVPERLWNGELIIPNGKITGFEPCWIAPGQNPPQIQRERAVFSLLSSTKTLKERSQNAFIFQIEAEPDSPVTVRMNGLEERGSLRELGKASRIMWFKDECVELLNDRAGIRPGSPEREDIYWHVAFKTKIHRPVPEAGHSAEFVFEDNEPLKGETNYRIRVEQRNAQRAWSSPIWVRPSVSGTEHSTR
jgi:hypothetical protein